MSQIDDVKDYVMRNRGAHTHISVQNALGGVYSLETIRAAFQQLKDAPSSGVEARPSAASGLPAVDHGNRIHMPPEVVLYDFRRQSHCYYKSVTHNALTKSQILTLWQFRDYPLLRIEDDSIQGPIAATSCPFAKHPYYRKNLVPSTSPF